MAFSNRIEELILVKSSAIQDAPQNAIALGREIHDAIKALDDYNRDTEQQELPNKRFLTLCWKNTRREHFLDWLD